VISALFLKTSPILVAHKDSLELDLWKSVNKRNMATYKHFKRVRETENNQLVLDSVQE
jgi:hypothetical protein